MRPTAGMGLDLPFAVVTQFQPSSNWKIECALPGLDVPYHSWSFGGGGTGLLGVCGTPRPRPPATTGPSSWSCAALLGFWRGGPPKPGAEECGPEGNRDDLPFPVYSFSLAPTAKLRVSYWRYPPTPPLSDETGPVSLVCVGHRGLDHLQ
jgi:hypothetical protein